MLVLAIISTVILAMLIIGIIMGLCDRDINNDGDDGYGVSAWIVISLIVLVIISIWLLYCF